MGRPRKVEAVAPEKPPKSLEKTNDDELPIGRSVIIGNVPDMPTSPSELMTDDVPDGPLTFLFFPEADKRRSPRVKITRLNEDKRWVTHGMLAPEEATEEMVAGLFGGGKYAAQLIQRQDDGKDKIEKTKTFFIPGKYRPPLGDLPGIALAANPTPPPGSYPQQNMPAPSANPNVMNAREAIDTALVSKVMEVLKPERAATNWPEVVVSLLTVATPIIQTMMEVRKPQVDPAISQLTETIRRLEERIAQPPQTPTPITGAAAAFKEMAEMRALLLGGVEAGEEKASGGADNMLMQLGMKVLDALGKSQPQPQPPQPPQNPALGQGGAPPMNPMEALLRQYGPQLVASAQRGMSPAFVAEMINNYVPQEAVGLLQELIARPDLATYLPQMVPGLQALPKWTTEFATELKAYGAEVEEGDDDEESNG